MKSLKITLVALLALLIISSIGGYIYFDKKFTPPPNYLKLSQDIDSIPITWVADHSDPRAALLLPVILQGIPGQFYMQFDLGAHSTLFYRKPLESLRTKFHDQIPPIDSTNLLTQFSFGLGKIKVTADQFRVIDHGTEINWADSTMLNIIGTIGADMIEDKIVIMDFKNNICFFGDSIAQLGLNLQLMDFKFDKRKVLLPATINGNSSHLLFDSGTSGFEFITSKNIWKKMALAGAQENSHNVNSWGNTLIAHNIESNKMIDFGMLKINLEQVSYIEGTSFLQNMLMRFSGMGGMIGNKLFLDKALILDCKNEKFGILDRSSNFKNGQNHTEE
jgi:hypothetical protein